ncbi:MAG: SRPBCC family protein [Sulfuricella sp.]|nr:SRPBCC family protein [Sulfuricella sp.]
MLQIHDDWARIARLALLYCFVVAGNVCADPLREPEVTVNIARGEETVVSVDAVMHVPVAPQEAWAVLTDFERFPDFIPNLQTSRIVSKPGEPPHLEQKGKLRYGILSFSYESLREFELTPPETIKSRVLKGNMKRMETITRIAVESGGVRITYHNEAVPSFWVAPLIGAAFIRHEVTEQFGAIIGEMLRRKEKAGGG